MRNIYTFFDILTRVTSGSRVRLAPHWAPLTLVEDTLPAVLQEKEWCTRRLWATVIAAWMNFWFKSHEEPSPRPPGASRAWICFHQANYLCESPVDDKRESHQWRDWRRTPGWKTSWPTVTQLHVSSWWTAAWKGSSRVLKMCKSQKPV